MRRVPTPTDAELEVLRVLWDSGPCTVRQLHQVLAQRKARGYTTILKTVQIMTRKGLLSRDASSRSHVYRPRVTETRTQRRLLRHLIDRAFGGSAAQLMLQVFGATVASPRELAELRTLLAERRRQGGHGSSRR